MQNQLYKNDDLESRDYFVKSAGSVALSDLEAYLANSSMAGQVQLLETQELINRRAVSFNDARAKIADLAKQIEAEVDTLHDRIIGLDAADGEAKSKGSDLEELDYEMKKLCIVREKMDRARRALVGYLKQDLK